MSVRRRLGGRRATLIAMGAAVAAGCMNLDGLFGPVEMHQVTVELRGTVTAADDGRPLAGVAVVDLASGDPSDPSNPLRSILTDSAGRYSLVSRVSCPVRSYGPCSATGTELMATLDGWGGGFEPLVADVRGVVPDAYSDTTRITTDFPLRVTRPIRLTLDGRVTLASGGDPVKGASVTIDWNPQSLPLEVAHDSTRTDSDGHYYLGSGHYCAVSGSSCVVSFLLEVATSGHDSEKSFENVDVAGDSIHMTVDFDDL